MPYFQLGSSVPNLPVNCVSNTPWTIFTYADGAHLQPTMIRSNYQASFMRNVSWSLTSIYSFPRMHSFGTLQLSVSMGDSSEIWQHLKPQLSTNSSQEHTWNDEIQVDCYSDSSESFGDEDHKEIQRRKKIGLANKGKTPWNKGRKHSAETRQRIKQRTIEALRDPKVKRKMSGNPRAHSDESKAKIGFSQRQVWRERLKRKMSREKIYLKWAESIAESAKRGGDDQQELAWDSYEKIKEEIAFQQLQRTTDKAKAKEIAKLRADIAAQAKAERMARLFQKRKEKGQKAKDGGEMKRKKAHKKIKKEKEGIPISKGLKLKARLTKIHKKSTINGEVASQGDMTTGHQLVIEAWDLEFVKREKMRRKVSLADQIQEAKTKRAESVAKEEMQNVSSTYSANGALRQLA